MKIYPYDPTTGKRLMRAGFYVNPIQPMTQEEVDRQCKIVGGVAEKTKLCPDYGTWACASCVYDECPCD